MDQSDSESSIEDDLNPEEDENEDSDADQSDQSDANSSSAQDASEEEVQSDEPSGGDAEPAEETKEPTAWQPRFKLRQQA